MFSPLNKRRLPNFIQLVASFIISYYSGKFMQLLN